MVPEMKFEEFLELVIESCKYRAVKEYVENCETCLNDDVVKVILGVRKDEKDV